MENNFVIKKKEDRGNYFQDGNIWIERFDDSHLAELDEILSKVQCVGGDAFTNSNITDLNIPNNIKKIAHGAFRYCRKLKNIELNGNIETIPHGCFSNCYNLESIVIPEGVKSICEDAFSECWNLKEVVLPSSLRRIGDRAFWGTQVQELRVPKGCVVNKNVLKDGLINYYEANIVTPKEMSDRTRIISRMILDYNYKLHLDRASKTISSKQMDEYEENMQFLKGLLNGAGKGN